MKRFWLGSAAPVGVALAALGGFAAPAAADGIELGLRGYMNTFFSVAGIDNGGGNADALALIGPDPREFNSTGLYSDGEIHFRGSYIADNGIAFGVRVELEASSEVNNDDSGAGDEIDERYIFVEGSFGRIEAGSTNTAAYQMHVAAPFVGVPVNSGWFTAFIPDTAGMYSGFNTPEYGTYLDYGNDENSLTYYTPRIWGFQLGLSYTPSVVDNGDGKNFPVEADKTEEFYNGLSVGLNYVEDWNGLGVMASAGYRRATTPDDLADFLDSIGIDAGNVEMVSAGLQLSYAGFALGGSYANQLSGPNFGVITTEGQSWDVGLSYTYGPWQVGATWMQSRIEGFYDNPILSAIEGVDTSGDSRVRVGSLGVSYDIGPGIQLSGTLMWARYDTEFGYEVEGVAGIVGTSLRF